MNPNALKIYRTFKLDNDTCRGVGGVGGVGQKMKSRLKMEKMNSRAIRVRRASRRGEIFEQGGVDLSVWR